MQVISFGSKASMATNAAKAGANALHKAPAKKPAVAQHPVTPKAQKPADGAGNKLNKLG